MIMAIIRGITAKTIPVAAAKQIKATMKLVPVGQRASKLHQELN